jgi:hypothetical protein
VTSAFGTIFGLDPGSINYGAPLHGEWYRSTIAHNTVCVDGQLQGNADGELMAWDTNGAVIRFEGAANRVYSGVSLVRKLELTTGELVDTFSCTSDNQHRYDWAFHSRGKLTTSLDLQDSRPGVLGSTNGYQHISKVRQASTEQDWWARWEHEGCSLELKVKGSPETTVFIGEGPGRTADERVALVIARRTTSKTVFATRHVYTKRG